MILLVIKGNFFDFFTGDIEDIGFLKWIDWNIFLTPVLWGIGLFFHGLFVFQNKLKFFRNWEERKIKEYMEMDEKEKEQTNQWK